MDVLLLSLTGQAGEPDPATSLQGKRVMVLGDSITQNGLYVSFIEYFLTKTYAPKEVDIISIGLSSETTSGLTERVHPGPRPCVFSRLKKALEGIKPQVVVACYGMNDGIYLPLRPRADQEVPGRHHPARQGMPGGGSESDSADSARFRSRSVWNPGRGR